MTRRVMPREALEAEQEPTRFMVKMPDGPKLPYNSSEFASAFVDADLFDAVLTAALSLLSALDVEFGRPVDDDQVDPARIALRAALRAYDEGQAQ